MSKLPYRRYWHSRVWQRECEYRWYLLGEKNLFKKRWRPLVRARQQKRMNQMPASQQAPRCVIYLMAAPQAQALRLANERHSHKIWVPLDQLPLRWALQPMSCPLRAISQFVIVLWTFGGLISQVHFLKVGVSSVEFKPFTPNGEALGFEILSNCRMPHRGWIYRETVSALSYPLPSGPSPSLNVHRDCSVFRFSSEEVVSCVAASSVHSWEEVRPGSFSIALLNQNLPEAVYYCFP